MTLERLTRRRQRSNVMIQIIGAALSALVPYIFLLLYLPADQDLALLRASLIGSFFASLIGIWILRSVSAYPGVEQAASILPAFSGSYSTLLLLFFISRFEYSRILVLGGFIFVLIWFYFIALARRPSMANIGIIGEDSDVEQLLLSTRGVHWTRMPSVNADIRGLDAIAVDLHAPLPAEWERRLTDFALIGLPVFHKLHLVESLSGMVPLRNLSENQFGTLSPLGAYMEVKRVIDWVAAAMMLVALAPVLMLVATVIKLDSPGPVFFRQVRTGYRDVPFLS